MKYSLAFLGIGLVLFSLGSMLSRVLVRYSYFLMLVSALFVLMGTSGMIQSFDKRRVERTPVILGSVGALLLLLFLGVQSPQLIFKEGILVVGVVLFLLQYIKHKKRS